jgi:hypothetical protein
LLEIFTFLHRIDVWIWVALQQVKGIARKVPLRPSTDSIVRVNESLVFHKKGARLPQKIELVWLRGPAPLQFLEAGVQFLSFGSLETLPNPQ